MMKTAIGRARGLARTLREAGLEEDGLTLEHISREMIDADAELTALRRQAELFEGVEVRYCMTRDLGSYPTGDLRRGSRMRSTDTDDEWEWDGSGWRALTGDSGLVPPRGSLLAHAVLDAMRWNLMWATHSGFPEAYVKRITELDRLWHRITTRAMAILPRPADPLDEPATTARYLRAADAALTEAASNPETRLRKIDEARGYLRAAASLEGDNSLGH